MNFTNFMLATAISVIGYHNEPLIAPSIPYQPSESQVVAPVKPSESDEILPDSSDDVTVELLPEEREDVTTDTTEDVTTDTTEDTTTDTSEDTTEDSTTDSTEEEKPPVALLQGNSVSLPILLYHSVVEDTNHVYYKGNPFIVSIEEMRSDLAYLQERGYTTVVMADLIDFVYHGGDLPAKPIMITFDDGYADNYTNLLPLLEEFDMEAVVCLIGSNIEQDTEGHKLPFLTAEMIQEMEDSGHIEFQCHTYDFHFSDGREGSLRLSGERLSDYQLAFKADLEANQAVFESLGLVAPTTFSYPGGQINRENSAIVQEEYIASLVTWPLNSNTITRGKESSLINLTRSNRDQGADFDAYFKALLAVK